jgi:hypothetical protein
MLCINSSEISKLTGHNKYIKSDEFVDVFIKNLYKDRNDLKEFDEERSVIKFITPEEKIENVLNVLSKVEQTEIKNIIKTEIKNNTSLQQNSNTLQTIISKSNISIEQKSKISDVVNSKINCNYGINTEDKSIKKYENKSGNTVFDNNIKCYTKYYDNFLICGKIDGLVIIEGKTYINEVKNRKNRIFNFIPIYEKVQLLSYTKLLNNVNIVFNQYKDEECKTEILEDYKDEKLWDLIIDRLNKYVIVIYKLRDDKKLRHVFLNKSIDIQYKSLKKYLDWL